MKDIWKQFTQREAHPAIQFVKYAIAGGIATAVDMVVFYLVSWFVIPALSAGDPVVRLLHLSAPTLDEVTRQHHFILNSAIAFMFSNLTAYVIDVFWVFHPGRHSRAVEIGLFYAVSLTSVCVGTALGWHLIRQFGLSTTASYGCKLVAAMLINYICRKFLVFKR